MRSFSLFSLIFLLIFSFCSQNLISENFYFFSEVVSSPHPQVPHAARFTFNESAQSARSNAPSGLEGIDDTRIDLSEEHGGVVSGRSVPTTPLQTSPNEENILNDSTSTSSTSSSISTVVQQDSQVEQQPVAGSSSQDVHESQVPEISVTAADDGNYSLNCS